MNRNEIKKIASLSRSRFRREYGLFLVEGFHTVVELLRSNWMVNSLIMTAESAASENGAICHQLASRRSIPVHIENAKDAARMATTETPQEILAVASIPKTDLQHTIGAKLILVADGIRDPGNLGSIIRSAVAFGFESLITTENSVDLFSPKVVRAAQGMMFQINLAPGLKTAEVVKALKVTHRLYALDTNGRDDLDLLEIPPRSALVVGAEIAGVGEQFRAESDSLVRIPMVGPAESLNAAVAASVAMYRFSRAVLSPR